MMELDMRQDISSVSFNTVYQPPISGSRSSIKIKLDSGTVAREEKGPTNNMDKKKENNRGLRNSVSCFKTLTTRWYSLCVYF